jgi:tripartite-type tricarboxylate transporter receptor subunit TctC
MATENKRAMPGLRQASIGAVVLACCAASVEAQGAKWPERPVRVVVPVAAGGGIDMVARLVAARFAEEFGQPFVVDNRTGAGGAIGAEIVARAAPDGHTLLVFGSSFPAIAALHKLPYDPVKGIASIGRIASGPYVLVVHPSVKATNLKEFIELARAEAGALNYGSAGTGSVPHLVAELFQHATRTRMVHVPYKGTAPALTDLLGGRIQVLFPAALSALPHIRAERLRAIAVTSGKRSPALPEVPAIGELIPGFAADLWYGMWAPLGTPKEIVSRLNQAIVRMVKLPDIQERLRADGVEPAPSTPEELARQFARELAMWSGLVKTAGIRIE